MITVADTMQHIHSDIRGPLYYEALAMERAGRPVLKLNTGNPAAFGFPMPQSVTEALTSHLGRSLGYCDFRGMEEARCAIAAYHRGRGIQDVTEEDVFIGNGVSEIVDIALSALLTSGDEVLVPTPCYSLWSNCVHLCGGVPVFYTCDEGADWCPDCDDIRRKITRRTRAIVIINPNNPTGALYPREVLTEIAAIARENDLLLFSDEIYDRLVLDGGEFTSTAAVAPDVPVITMNGLSKSHCLCGFRVGWMLLSGPRECFRDYRECLVKLTSLRLCANAPAQLVIPAALSDGEYTAAMLREGGRIYEQRRATVDALERFSDISFVKNRAAFYLFPRIDTKKHNVTSDKLLAHDILEATGILVVPGSGFEWKVPDHFRIVMLPQAEVLSRAMTRLGEFLEGYRQK